MTQEEVAARLGISRATIAQIELGNRRVSGLLLSQLAYLYGRDMAGFFKAGADEDRGALTALFRLAPELARQDSVAEALRRCVALGRELTRAERLLGRPRRLAIVASYSLPEPSGVWDAIVQGERLAHDERRRLGLELAPLPDITGLLEQQGVRTGLVEMPDDVSGLTVEDDDLGVLVVANGSHSPLRRRFSFAHEYCHVLVDRERRALVSTRSTRKRLLEVRANAFAAAFLMPREGVLRFLQAYGKGGPRRQIVEAFDEDGVYRARTRSEPGSQDIHIVDVVMLADYFGVSRTAACYRLKSLKVVNDAQLEDLLRMESEGAGRLFEQLVGLETALDHDTSRAIKRRFLQPAIEAWCREEISRRKFLEIMELAEVPRDVAEKAAAEWPATDSGATTARGPGD